MNWDAVSAIAELTGSLAVLATLIYLAVQLRQQNDVTRAQIEQQRADSVTQLSSLYSAGENLGLISKVMLDRSLRPEDLSKEELLHLRLVLSPLRANLENTYQQYLSGYISAELYEDVSKQLCIVYGHLLLRFGMPLTRSFRAELVRINREQVSSQAGATH